MRHHHGTVTDQPPSPPAAQPPISPDGRFWWNGAQWIPLPPAPMPGALPSQGPGAPGGGAGMHVYPGPTGPDGGGGGKVAGLVLIVVVLILAGAYSASTSGPSESFPEDQAAFVTAAQDAQSAAQNANEMQVVGLRKERATGMCAALGHSMEVTDWYGTVADVATTMGGDSGSLEVEMADDIRVGTWNNSFSDALSGDGTLIAADSPLYRQVAALEEGDMVRFSGSFTADKERCVDEQSITDVGGVESPTFTFAFTEVAAAD